MATTLTYLDSYCERAGVAGVFAEPLNLTTNIFFIAAALVAIYFIIRLPPEPLKKRLDLWLLVASLIEIGIGSGLWHAEPNGTTVLMDVIPITLFIHIYLISAMRRLLGFSWWAVLLGWAGYVGITILAQIKLPPDMLNGTIMYIPTYAALLVLTVAVSIKSRYLGKIFISMLMVWTLSLIFRTYDQEWCKILPMGTHFLWHSLNSWVLYRLLLALVRYRRPVPLPVAE